MQRCHIKSNVMAEIYNLIRNGDVFLKESMAKRGKLSVHVMEATFPSAIFTNNNVFAAVV